MSEWRPDSRYTYLGQLCGNTVVSLRVVEEEEKARCRNTKIMQFRNTEQTQETQNQQDAEIQNHRTNVPQATLMNTDSCFHLLWTPVYISRPSRMNTNDTKIQYQPVFLSGHVRKHTKQQIYPNPMLLLLKHKPGVQQHTIHGEQFSAIACWCKCCWNKNSCRPWLNGG